jgi:hydroxymethylbilane synthase
MAVTLRIGSRPSALALAQANAVARLLERRLAGLRIEVCPIRTTGDRIASGSLAQIGGKGLFIKELEQALRAGSIDLAVHSMKDLPARLDPAFRLAAVPEREDRRDAVVSLSGGGLSDLAPGARVGTSSARRRLQALHARPDLKVVPLRGNVDTRLARLEARELDAVILALAGLKRLDRVEGLRLAPLDEGDFVPAAGQGALAVEALAGSSVTGSSEIEQAVVSLDNPAVRAETVAERAFLATIGASCASAVGVTARVAAEKLKLRAIIFGADRIEPLEGSDEEAIRADANRCAEELGERLGHRMLQQGAAKLLHG